MSQTCPHCGMYVADPLQFGIHFRECLEKKLRAQRASVELSKSLSLKKSMALDRIGKADFSPWGPQAVKLARSLVAVSFGWVDSPFWITKSAGDIAFELLAERFEYELRKEKTCPQN